MVDKRATIRAFGQRGFSLVEAIVAGAIAVIIATVMLTLFQVNGQSASRGGLNAMIQMQYETALSQIGQTARKANAVLQTAPAIEGWSISLKLAAVSNVSQITMFDTSGAAIGGYEICASGGEAVLKERLSDGSWTNFKVGSKDVRVSSQSNFSLSADRKWLTVNIAVISSTGPSAGAICDTAPAKGEVFQCRN
jgi:type II secretory pathway pseudopilin PulG